MQHERQTALRTVDRGGELLELPRVPREAKEDHPKDPDLLAGWRGPSGGWTFWIALAPRWRWYFGLAGGATLLLLLAYKVAPFLPVLTQLLKGWGLPEVR
jgi:hypothetical protein